MDQQGGSIKLCGSCEYFIAPDTVSGSPAVVGVCRRHAPNADIGYPPVILNDWCGDHRLDKNKVSVNQPITKPSGGRSPVPEAMRRNQPAPATKREGPVTATEILDNVPGQDVKIPNSQKANWSPEKPTLAKDERGK